MTKRAIIVTVLLAFTFAGGAQAATKPTNVNTNAVKRLFVWIQGRLLPPVPSPEPTSAPADQTRQGS